MRKRIEQISSDGKWGWAFPGGELWFSLSGPALLCWICGKAPVSGTISCLGTFHRKIRKCSLVFSGRAAEQLSFVKETLCLATKSSVSYPRFVF